MKIICTEQEKQTLIYAYEHNPKANCCLAKMEAGCATKYKSCAECLDKNIEWEIQKNKAEGV